MIIKLFRIFESKDEIVKTCKLLNIFNYSINPDGSVDVSGSVSIELSSLEELPLKFRNVSGNFFCNRNNIESLEGCPRKTHNFICSYNKLKSLVGGPEISNGDYICSDNYITSLVGGPKYVEDDFDFSYNQITSFEGFPENVGGLIFCGGNPVYEIFRLHPDQDFIDLVNEYDVIRDGNKIVWVRLKQALEDSGQDNIPEEFIFENYQLI